MNQFSSASELASWLNSAFEKQLISVFGRFYGSREEVVADQPQALWITFEQNPEMRLSTRSDGESLNLDQKSPEPVDLGEYGQEVLIDLMNYPPWKQLLGRKLTNSYLLVSNDAIIGVSLHFDNRKKVIVINWGDQLYVWDRLDKQTMLQEAVQFVRIIGDNGTDVSAHHT
jgi:hypothetical protein